ncbi:pyridoxamine 5'-phosphate oxidase family protein [Methanolapillus ohkumae]|uniref:Pyridoxamine 5'-phosphate oxidase family protein n=1 Tax=Methanolapillus ohkumae TaxID=3028298 RepID=A0AA96V6Q6_9EURY|nr:hypothetical protein MsAm2_09690 [Methanosarcinaceae archaeon Am2]
MQNRMKTHQLSENEIRDLLKSEPVGRLGTADSSGFPYVVPVHFVYEKDKNENGNNGDGKIYIHGLIKGEKLENIRNNPKVGFEVDKFEKFVVPDDNDPCGVNTVYQSVIIKGTAKTVADEKEKEHALRKIVEKYTPSLFGQEFGNSIKATAVIEISIQECTGKYYK